MPIPPQSPGEFFKTTWEKKPAFVKSTPERQALFTGMCSLPALRPLLLKREAGDAGPLEW
jgi:hypothetical protein